MDDDKLDFLAVEQRVLFYSTDLTPDVKRKLILNSIYWHMTLGTRKSMEEILNIIFKNENTKIEEWYEYGGEPYHFKVLIDSEKQDLQIDDIAKKIKLYKRLIAHLDSVNIRKIKQTKLYIGQNKEVFVKTNFKVNPYNKTLNRNGDIKIAYSNLRYIKIYYKKGRK